MAQHTRGKHQRMCDLLIDCKAAAISCNVTTIGLEYTSATLISRLF